MNKESLVLANGKQNSFLLQCFFNEWVDSYQECMAILETSDTSEEVIRKVLESDTMKGSQIYAELSKTQPDHWKRIRDDIGNWTITTSDAGGLKIGNETFSVNVPNGYGDGEMMFTVVEKGCFNNNMLDYWTTVSGEKIQIYDYDCGSESNVIDTVSGRFGIYSGYGFVVLEKWS